MARKELTAVTNLITSAESGGYGLPKEIIDAYQTLLAVKALEIPSPKPFDVETAAARVVSSVAAGKGADIVAATKQLITFNAEAAAYDSAKSVLALAIEQAANAAYMITFDSCERVITDFMRPALHKVHDEARQAAGALKGYSLDPVALMSAPAKARDAFTQLPLLVHRRKAIFEGRAIINRIGARVPQHDEANLYGEFESPLSFFPWWIPTSRVPEFPAPTDPAARLLWVVGEGAIAKPWLPTVAEQDAAWWAQFGVDVETRRQTAFV
jgi:hypothetical protein